MIYESAYVLRPEASEEAIALAKSIVKETLAAANGEILVDENWGVKQFAQQTESGLKRGNYFYVMYKAGPTVNIELERRFNISEDIMRFLFVKLGEDKDQEVLVKGYKNPNHGNKTDATIDSEKEKKMFQKRKSCYFSEKKTAPDWKDPSSYSWLVNEFGKISPARVTGLRPKYQRLATTAIKRGRNMGMISYMSSHTLR